MRSSWLVPEAREVRLPPNRESGHCFMFVESNHFATTSMSL